MRTFSESASTPHREFLISLPPELFAHVTVRAHNVPLCTRSERSDEAFEMIAKNDYKIDASVWDLNAYGTVRRGEPVKRVGGIPGEVRDDMDRFIFYAFKKGEYLEKSTTWYHWWFWWWWLMHLHADGDNEENEFHVVLQVSGEAVRGDRIGEMRRYKTSPGQCTIMRYESRARSHFISAGLNRAKLTMSGGATLKFNEELTNEDERAKVAEAYAAATTLMYHLKIVEKYQR